MTETFYATVELPITIKQITDIKEWEINRFIRQTLAVELYREGRVSLGKAAEIAGVRNKWEMLIILSSRNVPIDYTAEDAEKDLRTLKHVLKR